ncbi:hypothetical protein Trco_002663 [Trichoderma cornu-damae]|uniref:DUF3752 domain-containing protein n=1 Tax=Trichoderma cornu-damae TaxID=654480 RepID=A0A9P8QVB3_9HYPO|nr:hypothetical protein Trco_002663 [Trichoderma cornu-damae]
MPSIGPQLPPHLLKRRRDSNDDDDDADDASSSSKHPRRDDAPAQHLQNHDEIHHLNGSGSDSEDDYAPPRPSALPAPAPAAAPTVGPSLPPHLAANNNGDEINLSDSDSDTGPAAPAPAPAPAPANPDSESSEGDDDDDDDFGPSLPSASAPRARQIGPSLPPSELDGAPRRDEWMLAPPPPSSTFSERDTTRIRARKFASKPGPSPSPSSAAAGPSSIWTETPEEKLKRLQDSVLGRTGPASDAGAPPGLEDERRKKQLRDEALSANIQAQRGKALLEEHRGGGGKAAGARRGRQEEEEDDPSKRAFDREKDMAIGGRITSAQRRELINKSANFGGRFQKGSFL